MGAFAHSKRQSPLYLFRWFLKLIQCLDPVPIDVCHCSSLSLVSLFSGFSLPLGQQADRFLNSLVAFSSLAGPSWCQVPTFSELNVEACHWPDKDVLVFFSLAYL